MTFAIEIPDEVSLLLAEKWGDLPRHIRESIAAEGYASGALTSVQVRKFLGHQSRMETIGFLSRRGVWPRTDVEEFEADLANLERLRAS